mmetsp:Transcript_49862/g.160626  ORF Transcript_49862/g.160626 Transcript_49862/m.160626 type:complete len:281 (+) Transcript_49862:67-909(+)
MRSHRNWEDVVATRGGCLHAPCRKRRCARDPPQGIKGVDCEVRKSGDATHSSDFATDGRPGPAARARYIIEMDFQVTRARMLTCGWTGTCRRELSRQAVRDEWALSRMVTIITMRLRADTAGNVQRLPSGKRLVAVALLLLLLEDAKDEIALGDVGGEEGGVVWRHAEHAPVVRDGGHNLHTHRLLRVFRDVFGRVKVKADGWHQARRFECRRDVVLLRLQDLVKARYQPHVLGHCLNSVLRGHQHGALVLALAVPLLLGEEGLLLLFTATVVKRRCSRL